MKKYSRDFKRAPEPELYEINHKIMANEVMVIGPDGPLGVMNKSEALAKAMELELDLVLVGPKAEPPVAKIMNYNSFKYQKEKEARKNKAASKKTQLKTLRLSPRIGQHDLEVRLKKAKEFIEDGDKVRVEILLRGREKAHADVAFEVVKKFLATIQEQLPIKIESNTKKEGAMISAQFAPLSQPKA